MKKVPLSQGQVALIDDEDYELISKYKWSLSVTKSGHRYAITRCKRTDDTVTTMKMHRLLMKAQSDQQIDHIDGDGLNNRRDNLRIATPSQNRKNSKMKWHNSSGYKGVSWDSEANKWVAQIDVGRKHINLGRFRDKEKAREAYDQAALKYFGEFAWTNKGRL